MTSMDNGDGQGRTANNDTTYCGFQVGQHVVCVRDDTDDPNVEVLSSIVRPEKGRVYTIRGVRLGVLRKVVCLRFVEIPDQIADVLIGGELFHGDVIFDAANFRPLQKLTPEQFVTTDAPVDERRAVLA